MAYDDGCTEYSQEIWFLSWFDMVSLCKFVWGLPSPQVLLTRLLIILLPPNFYFIATHKGEFCVCSEHKAKGPSLIISQCISHVAQQHCNGLKHQLQNSAFKFLPAWMTTHAAFSTKTTHTTHSCSDKGLTPQAGRKFQIPIPLEKLLMFVTHRF